ncbi:MAG TPA: D-alanine--D-alanine ligase, partial [Acidimicrobiales bacterium]|nr:D-alanine--D-alanine ligase [Acidimicrobiales bacterium]
WISGPESLGVLPAGAAALPSPDDFGGPEVDPLPAVADPQGEVRTVVFPLVHGPMGEDGTLQGLLELAGVAYVGAGVTSSALCMDKALSKRVLRTYGLPVVPWLDVRRHEVGEGFAARVAEELGYPVFVKPANLGSSIGITKASGPEGLESAVAEALRYDEYVVVEQAIGAREIELAVIGDEEPRVSVPGEIVPGHEFYDYEDKYLEDGAELIVPAPLDTAQTDQVRDLAGRAYRALRVDGMARVDFFLEADGRGFLVNELNTLPGFTPISMFPRLWAASGLAYPDLVDELVRLALERQRRRSRFQVTR